MKAVSPKAILQSKWLIRVSFLCYMLIMYLFVTLRIEHIIIGCIFIIATFFKERGLRFCHLAFPFVLAGLIYDNVRYFLSFRGSIHTEDLYLLEKQLFSVTVSGKDLILPEYFGKNHHPILDVLCGFSYFIYVFEIPLLGILLYFRNQSKMQLLGWAWVIMNLLGCITYIAYPAAPPWYITKYGYEILDVNMPPDPAGAARFDEITGLNLIHSLYQRSSNVFGAMPSLHAGNPFLAAVIIFITFSTRWFIPSLLFALLVAFSAIYLQHHYILDVLVGWVYSIFAFTITYWYFTKKPYHIH